MQLLLGLAIGIAFGYILQRTAVTNCSCIRGAMALTDFHMLKVIMAAVGVGMILVFPLSTLGIINFSVKATYVVGVGLGGLIFGAGMALAGFCPGTVLAALPRGGKHILWTLAGAVAGSFAYSLVYAPLKPLLITPLNYGKLTLPQVLGTDPVATGVVLGGLILLGLAGLEWLTARRQSRTVLPNLEQMGGHAD